MSQQIQITGGAKVRDLQDVIIGTSGVLSSVAFNVANGVPKLDVNGKILVSQLPNSVMEYKGVWNAATNTPTLTNGGAFNQGDVYLCDTAGTVNFGSGSPISFIVGDQAIYSGSVWQKAGGATGTVTSVGLSTNAGAITIGNSPISTSGTITANFNGTNLQYVNGAGNLTTFPTLITSIGLSMPSAFSVANSPLTANGTIAVTGAGTTAQYIRGDGSLATFPTIATEAQRLITEVYNETGATLTKGTVVYINGGHGNLPTITKAIATGDATSAQTYGIVQTDITNNNNGFVVVIGSLGDLDTQAYPNGTQLYLSSTVAGQWTSVKQYAPAHLVYVAIVTRSHPTQGVVEVRIQNGFEMDELHNVSAQTPSNNQGLFYNTSTSLWENKSIATALGYTPANDANVVHLTGNETIGGTKTFSDATKNNGGIFLQNASSSSLAGYMNIGGLTNGVKFTSGGGISNSFTLPSATGYTFTFPNATGTLALTSDIPSLSGTAPISYSAGVISISQATTSTNGYLSSTDWNTFNLKQAQLNGTGFVKATGTTISYDNSTYALDSAVVHNTGNETIGGAKTFSTFTKFDGGVILKNNVSASLAGYVGLSAYSASGNKGINIDFDTYSCNLFFNGTLPYGYTFPNANGTIALTSDIPSLTGYVTLATTQTISGAKTFSAALVGTKATFNHNDAPIIDIQRNGGTDSNTVLQFTNASRSFFIGSNGTVMGLGGTTGSIATQPLQIDSTGAATFTGALSGTSATFSGTLTAQSNIDLTGDLRFQSNAGYGLKSANGTRLFEVYNTGISFVTPLSGTSATFTSSVTALGIIYANAAETNTINPVTSGNIIIAGGYSGIRSAVDHSFNIDVYNSASPINALKITQAGASTFYSSVTANIITSTSAGSTQLFLKSTGGGSNRDWQFQTGETAAGDLSIMQSTTAGGATYATKVNISPTGNLGLGVTPSAWGSSYAIAQYKGGFVGSSANSFMYYGQNGYSDGSNFRYVADGYAVTYAQDAGEHIFYTAPSRSAGTTISYTPRMTITNAGYVGINYTGGTDQLSVGGPANSWTTYLQGSSTTSQSYGLNVAAGTNSSDISLLVQSRSGTLYLRVRGDGVALFGGSVTATSFFESSDSRLKTLIQDNYQTKGIASITPKLYTKNGKVELGYYAQDFVGILDSAIVKGSDEMLSLSYREVHTAKIYALEQEIKELKAKMN